VVALFEDVLLQVVVFFADGHLHLPLVLEELRLYSVQYRLQVLLASVLEGQFVNSSYYLLLEVKHHVGSYFVLHVI